MDCPSCGAANRGKRRFCSQCGSSLPVVCPHCEGLNEAGDRFCGDCGGPLAEAAPGSAESPAAYAASPSRPAKAPGSSAAGPGKELERRQITVLFCDLVGSTALSRRLDPEDLQRVMRVYRDACVRVIKAYEGEIGRFTGDGILAYFGYPQAHEEDPERAVHAGLAIVTALQRVRVPVDGGPIQPAVRVGIATGLVVAGDLIGEGRSSEEAVVGETPNLAARLQAVAEPDTVLIGPATHRLVGHLFRLRDLGPHRLKGFAEEVPVWQVLNPVESDSRFAAAHGQGLTPLVSREEELEILLRRWHRVVQGSGQLLLLTGEAGIGKSRMIEEFRRRSADRRSAEMRLQCLPYHRNSVLHPFVHQLGRLLDPAATAGDQRRHLKQLLGSLGERAEVLEPLAELAGLPPDDSASLNGLGPERRRSNIIAGLLEVLMDWAREGPRLMVIEDIHWLDPTSFELLDGLVERLPTAGLMLILSSRPEPGVPWLHEPQVTLVALRRLDDAQSADLVAGVLGGRHLPKAVLAEILKRTDGVPLFVEELTKSVLASGLLEARGENYVLRPDLPEPALPNTLKDSLMARLDRLGAAKEVAQVGAVVGREFSLPIIRAVCGLPESWLLQALQQLIEAGILTRRKSLPEAVYSFRHALVQETAAASVLKSRRRELHGSIGDFLAQQYPDLSEREPELLAYHYGKGGRPGEAVNYWLRAGEKALRGSANLEVIAQLRQALKTLQELPDNVVRQQQELAVQIGLGTAYRATRGFASREVEACFSRARELCLETDAPEVLVDVLRGLYACYIVRGELQAALSQAQQVLEIGRRIGSQQLLSTGRYLLGTVRFWQGDFPGARRALEQAAAAGQERRPEAGILSTQLDPAVTSLGLLSWTLWLLGYPAQAGQAADRALVLARRLGQPLTLAMVLSWACWTRACLRPGSINREGAAELQRITGDNSLLYLATAALHMQGEWRIDEGQFEEGLVHVLEALQRFRQMGAGIAWGWAVAAPVQALCGLGRLDEAEELLAEGFAAVDERGERHWEAELHRLRGELHLARKPAATGEADACFRKALEVAHGQQARALALRAAISRAELLQAKGSRAEALQVLRSELDWFSEGFDSHDLRRASALLAALQQR